MFPLRFSPVIAAFVLLVGLGAAVLLSSPALAAPDGAWIGVRLQELDENLREAMNIDRQVRGALVSDVMDGSPAEKAGIEDGDVIVEVGDRRTTDLDEVTSAVRELKQGEKARLVVIRSGQTRGLDIVPSPRPEDKSGLHQELKQLARRRAEGGYLGVQSMELGELADYFGVAEDAGVLVTEVVEDGPAAEAGLKAGDVILAVGDEEVSDPEELREAVREHKPEESVDVAIVRRGERSSITVKLGEASDMGDAEMLFLSPEDGRVVIPEIPRIPRIDVQAPNFQWRGEGDAHVLRLDEEELQKFKEELHKSLDEMRKQLDEMKRELKRAHEDEDSN